MTAENESLAGLFAELSERPAHERGVAARIRIFGENTQPVAEARFYQGIYLQGVERPEHAGDLDAARATSRRAAAVSEAVLGAEHPFTVWAVEQHDRLHAVPDSE